MTEALTIYIGYDPREDDAYQVCRASLLRRSSKPLHIVKLDREALSHAGFHDRSFWQLSGGQRVDRRDGKPFSTDFSFTRFLVPALSMYEGWSLFCDCDFLFTADIAGLFDLADDRYAAMCVKRTHEPMEAVKMDGMEQTRYYRKNWSSLCLFNNSHPRNRSLTRLCVNEMKGSWLHAFSWLRDELIGELPPTWNFLVDIDEPPEQVPCGIHFTLGVPVLPGYENCSYADLWRAEKDSRRYFTGPFPTEFLRAREPVFS